jgi:hypothetical protein
VADWTLESASAALPRVREVVRRIRELVGAGRERSRRVGGNGAGSSNGHGPSRSSENDELPALVDELTSQGIVLRDPDRGLVDFPARSPSGREYLLCWLDGEAAIEWWHWPDDGFAGRTPLSDPPP